MKMVVTLTPKAVEQILKEHLEQNFKTVGEVKLEVGEELIGLFTTIPVFKGATCEVEK